MDHIFRQYDIRGKVGLELPLDQVYKLTQAIAYYFIQQNPQIKTVAVGADGRTHSPAIKEQVCKALQESGLNVIFVGICPTPVLYFSLFTLAHVDAGLMITASHNGKEYNGIKICLGKNSVWGQQIQEIKKLYKAGVICQADSIGSYTEKPMIDYYIQWLYDHFPSLVGMQLAAVIDCGNGAAGTVLPQLIEKMQWHKIQLLYPEVDGTYPHHEADPTVEKNMLAVQQLLAQNSSLEIGLGLDGDCDRMAPMTKQGELVAGDKLLALFAQNIVRDYPGACIVFDIKCSAGLPELLVQWGAKPSISPSGHSIIKDQMKKQHALLAGELSCHFFFHDRYFGYDDGIYAAMRLFELLQGGKTLSELLAVFPKKYSTPELRIECQEWQKEIIVERIKNSFVGRSDVHMITLDGIRVTMEYGWGMIRASNTQSVVCLRFESDSLQGLERIKQEFMQPLEYYFATTALKQEINY